MEREWYSIWAWTNVLRAITSNIQDWIEDQDEDEYLWSDEEILQEMAKSCQKNWYSINKSNWIIIKVSE